MKKLLLLISFVFLLVGCSDKETVKEEKDNAKPESNAVAASNDQEKEELQKLLEQRPNVTSDQLRTTMNLSLKILDAMVKKDYVYLESVANDNVTIDKENNAFRYKDGFVQNFFQTIDYSKLEFRGINLNDNVITVNFAENNHELVFQYTVENDKFLLKSFLTN